jgi:hypothetical protein
MIKEKARSIVSSSCPPFEDSGYPGGVCVSPPALTLVLTFIDGLLSRGGGNMIRGKSTKCRQQFERSIEVSGITMVPGCHHRL